MLKWAGAWSGVVLVVLGCASAEKSDGVGNSAGRGGEAGTGQTPIECVAGQACVCGTGQQGVTTCDEQGRQSCDCPSCPPFDPTAGEAPFEACGGEPFGSWLLKSHDVSAVKGNFYYSNLIDSATVSCPSDAHELQPAKLLLILRDGGAASVLLKDDQVSYSVSESCIEAKVPGCKAFKGCSLHDCGICTCSDVLGEVTSDDAT